MSAVVHSFSHNAYPDSREERGWEAMVWVILLVAAAGMMYLLLAAAARGEDRTLSDTEQMDFLRRYNERKKKR